MLFRSATKTELSSKLIEVERLRADVVRERAELERLRSELLSTISKHTTRSAPEPRDGEGRRKRANIAKAAAEEKTEALEPAEA